MKLSVLIVTYNHEEFIAQALDGVLTQQVDFDYEIVVGEDCSTDSTRNILLEYHEKYPHKIRLLLNEVNKGACENFVQAFMACSGDYIAYLDGDDYWTSAHKLQKQVDFLDGHSDCAICFHPVKVIDNNYPDYSSILPLGQQKNISTMDDLVRVNFIPSCSAVFRGGLFDTFPAWYYTLEVGDWPLHILNAKYGNIGFIDEVMSVYRLHRCGAWSGENEIVQIEKTIQVLNSINFYLEWRYDKSIKYSLANHYYGLARVYDAENQAKNAKKYLLKCFTLSFPVITVPVIGVMGLVMKLYVPKVYNLLKGIMK